MKRIVLFGAVVASFIVSSAGSTLAQDEERIRPAFSDVKLTKLGYPEMTIEALEAGFEVPTQIAVGYTLVTLESLPDYASYVDFMQPSPGLTTEEATELALQSAAEDIPHEGWVYAGGSYAVFGNSVSFVVNLTPGEWQVAASYQIGEGEEVMTLYPLTVTEPSDAQTAPPAGVSIEMNDTEFLGLDQPVGTGPQIYQVTNIGEAPRQMVVFGTPREVTVEDFEQAFASFGQATPAPTIMDEMIWVGYNAILSPGQTVWIEMDLDPGTYAATSWVINPETGAPALLLGMIANFEVTA